SGSTLQDTSTSERICTSGFIFGSSTSASLVSNDAVWTMRNGASMIPSATWIDAEPEPFLPYSVYIVPPCYPLKKTGVLHPDRKCRARKREQALVKVGFRVAAEARD